VVKAGILKLGVGRVEVDTAGIAELAGFCREHTVELVVMEASGGYERRAFVVLWEKGISCALIEAVRVAWLGNTSGKRSASRRFLHSGNESGGLFAAISLNL
jgi:transposase